MFICCCKDQRFRRMMLGLRSKDNKSDLSMKNGFVPDLRSQRTRVACMSDDLNLGRLIHYVSGDTMPKPCKAMGNLKSDTSLIHQMIFWIVYNMCLSITSVHSKILPCTPKYYQYKYNPIQRYQELQRMDLLKQIRCQSER